MALFRSPGDGCPMPKDLEGLVKSACVKSYPIMVAADGAPVAQAESTVNRRARWL